MSKNTKLEENQFTSVLKEFIETLQSTMGVVTFFQNTGDKRYWNRIFDDIINDDEQVSTSTNTIRVMMDSLDINKDDNTNPSRINIKQELDGDIKTYNVNSRRVSVVIGLQCTYLVNNFIHQTVVMGQLIDMSFKTIVFPYFWLDRELRGQFKILVETIDPDTHENITGLEQDTNHTTVKFKVELYFQYNSVERTLVAGGIDGQFTDKNGKPVRPISKIIGDEVSAECDNTVTTIQTNIRNDKLIDNIEITKTTNSNDI